MPSLKPEGRSLFHFLYFEKMMMGLLGLKCGLIMKRLRKLGSYFKATQLQGAAAEPVARRRPLVYMWVAVRLAKRSVARLDA